MIFNGSNGEHHLKRVKDVGYFYLVVAYNVNGWMFSIPRGGVHISQPKICPRPVPSFLVAYVGFIYDVTQQAVIHSRSKCSQFGTMEKDGLITPNRQQ